MSSTNENEKVDPSVLEEGRGNGHIKHHHHHHHHHPAKRVKQMAKARRQKREANRLQGKLPGLLHVEDGDIKKLRKRLVIKNELVAAVAEFCGTFLFLFFAFGIATQAGQQQLTQSAAGQTQNAGVLDTSQLLYSSLGFGFSLAVNAWVFFRISGGLFNPAVTLGLFLCGALTWYRSIILFIVQFVAAICAAGIAQVVIPGGINARTKLGDNTSLAQGFFIEMFCTCLLMFAIYMLAGEKHKATFLAPVGIGLALFLAELFATGLTGGSLNPARSLGPDVVARAFDHSAWIYYTAPFVGTLLSAAVYWLLKASKYETANEGQDGDDTQALVLRDTKGNVTGAVQRVDIADAPQIAQIVAGADANRSTISLVPEGAKTDPLAGASRAPSIISMNLQGDRANRPPSIISVAPEGDRASLYPPAASPMAVSPTTDAPSDAVLLHPTSQDLAEKEKEEQPALATHDFTKDKSA